MVRGRSAKPLCSGSIPLDSLKAVQAGSLFFSERHGKAGSVYIKGTSKSQATVFLIPRSKLCSLALRQRP